jgi:DNA modification methylase
MSNWTLHLGNCLDPVTGLASLADKSVDHVICDPPYEAEAHTKGRRAFSGGSDEYAKGGVGERPLDFEPITEEQRAAAAGHLARLSRRWILVFCQVEAAMKWRDVLASAGATYKRSCVWIKPGASPQFTGDRPGMGYETIVACHAPGRSSWNGGGQHGVFTHTLDPHDSRVHTTQKPEGLMELLVRLFSDSGEMILDPFAGSGTTGVAAIRNGRRFIGWEKDPKYHAIATKRLSAAREQMALFGGAA